MKFPDEVSNYLRKRKLSGQGELQDQIRRAYKQLLTLIPLIDASLPQSILDIGCGLGCVDVLLARLGVKVVHLMDGDGTALRRDDYAVNMEAWNDVKLAADIVQMNAPADTVVHAHRVDPDLYASVEMIISFKSWGTHYPVATYLPLAQRCLKPGGLLVLDLRKGIDVSADVREIVDAGFEVCMQLSDRQWAFVRR